MAGSTSTAEKRAALEKLLDENSITYEVTEHPAVFTVEEQNLHLTDVKGACCKNLFLKDKKKNLYLLSCLSNAQVNLKDISKSLGIAGGLRFADESTLLECLGVTQGSVTALALYYDTQAKVRFLCDQRLLDDSFTHVNFHPMINTATLTLSVADFIRFLSVTSHDATPVNMSSSEQST